MTFLKTEFIKINKSAWIKNRLLISIDSGNSLTKLLFLNKIHEYLLNNEEEASILLNFVLFKNSDFDSALEYIKKNAYFPENNNSNLYVTGVFALKNLEKIKSTLNVNAVFVDEFFTIAESHRFLVEHLGVENFLADQFKESGINEKRNNESLTNLYPCMFHVHGSSSGCFYFSNHESAEFWSLLHQGGKTFLGLAKCLLNTNDYDEIVSLASQGNKCNVDTQVKEMFDQSFDSPYNGLPPDMPMFSYGKCMDLNKGKEDFSKHDLAASLISYHIKFIIMFSASICAIKKVSKIYLTGNIFNSEVFQKEVKQLESIFPLALELIVLNFGYFGALGAMLYDENNAKIFFKNIYKT